AKVSRWQGPRLHRIRLDFGIGHQPFDISGKIGARDGMRRHAWRRTRNAKPLDALAALARITSRLAPAPPLPFDRVNDPRHRHAAAMGKLLLILPADQERKIDRLGDEQRDRHGKDKLADQALWQQAEPHDTGPSRLTSHASV